MAREQKISRKKLASYAQVLGRNSLAAMQLKDYDRLIEEGRKVTIYMHNNGFRLKEEK